MLREEPVEQSAIGRGLLRHDVVVNARVLCIANGGARQLEGGRQLARFADRYALVRISMEQPDGNTLESRR